MRKLVEAREIILVVTQNMCHKIMNVNISTIYSDKRLPHPCTFLSESCRRIFSGDFGC